MRFEIERINCLRECYLGLSHPTRIKWAASGTARPESQISLALEMVRRRNRLIPLGLTGSVSNLR